jgi:hypothetical protein
MWFGRRAEAQKQFEIARGLFLTPVENAQLRRMEQMAA